MTAFNAHDRNQPGVGSGTAEARTSRLIVAAIWMLVAAGASIVSAACWLGGYEEVVFHFENRTDILLCSSLSPEDASSGDCNELRSNEETTWLVGCGDGPDSDRARITVYLTEGPDSLEVYSRTEECRVWQDSSRKFIIEEDGDDFIVTDPLS